MSEVMLRVFRRWQELSQTYPINEGYDHTIILRGLADLFEMVRVRDPAMAERIIDEIVGRMQREGSDNVHLLVTLFRELAKVFYNI